MAGGYPWGIQLVSGESCSILGNQLNLPQVTGGGLVHPE
jgi:hypothetical protein